MVISGQTVPICQTIRQTGVLRVTGYRLQAFLWKEDVAAQVIDYGLRTTDKKIVADCTSVYSYIQ